MEEITKREFGEQSSAVLILPDETHLDLGAIFHVYKDFAEIARAVGPDFSRSTLTSAV